MIRPNDNVGVTFINTVLGRGILGNIINVQLGVFNFSEDGEGKIHFDPSIASRLRMDIDCAKQLRDALDWCVKTWEEKQAEKPVESFSIKRLNGKPRTESKNAS